MARKLLLLVTMTLALIVVSACGGSSPQPNTSQSSSQALAEGKAVFDQNCNSCHPGGGQGAGPALKGKSLSADSIRSQVRNGGGAMPAFPPSKISDQQLAALIEYVQSLK